MLTFEWLRQGKSRDVREWDNQRLSLGCALIEHLSPGDMYGIKEASPSDDVGS